MPGATDHGLAPILQYKDGFYWGFFLPNEACRRRLHVFSRPSSDIELASYLSLEDNL